MAKAKKRKSGDLTVVLDAGHGLPDPGAVGVAGLQEQAVALKVCELVEEILEDEGVTVKMTRETEILAGAPDVMGGSRRKAVNKSLQYRVQVSREIRPDVFVSIHCNGAASKTAEGFEVFYNTFEGKAIGKRAGEAVFDAMKRRLESHKPRRVEPARYYVLRKQNVPAILVELEFITNPTQEKIFRKDKSLKFYADTIAEGILKGIN